MTFRIGVLLAAALVSGGSAAHGAQATATDSARIERLAALGRLWVSIKYFHPWLAYRPVDWDAAAGRDEVLDGALRYLEGSLPKTSTR